MALQPFQGFNHFTTHHCVTGSLRHIYEFYGFQISEEMLLGLGAGVGFIYWHTRGTLPFMGGRANVGRPGEEGLEKATGRRTGVRVEAFRTDSPAKAEKKLLETLGDGQPVMLVLDMGFLPYFDFGGEEFHFGYHTVVACGYEAETRRVLLADRDEVLHPVSLEALARARGSKFQPFPPHHTWYSFDFQRQHPPAPGEILAAIRQCAQAMLEPPITNLGVKGIHKAAPRIRLWPQIMDEKTLRDACLSNCIMIDARGGTGGGLFRYMYGRFLQEAAVVTGEAELYSAGERICAAGDRWQTVAEYFERAYAAENPARFLDEVCALLPEIAREEEIVWDRLREITGA